MKAIQQALKNHGFNPGPVDGVMGPKTEAAIIKFKVAHGLKARSFVGPITARLLGIAKPKESKVYTQTWMTEGDRHMGLREIPGKRHNKTIVRWTKELGGWWSEDETPWCGTFVGHCLRTSGHSVPKYWMRAKAYLDWGMEVPLQVGAIVIFGRKGGGHVGFVVGMNDKYIYVLGGNQRNQVNISPIDRDRLLGVRWPSESQPTNIEVPQMSGGRKTTNEA